MSPTVPSSTSFRRLKLRRDTSSKWASINPVLSEGEPAVELDTGRIKIGDGITSWNDLGFLRSTEMIEHVNSVNPHPVYDQGRESTDITAHIDSETPHPVYDDGPSLALLYQNAKV
jgi:hypothetical protein